MCSLSLSLLLVKGKIKSSYANLVLILVCTVVTMMTSVQTSAQPAVCPPGFTSDFKIFTYPYNGGCCSLKVSYCYKLHLDVNNQVTKFEFEMGSIEVLNPTGSCWSLDPTQTPPISGRNVLENAKKQILLDQVYLGRIPNCPQWATMTIEETTNTCRMWFHSVVLGSDKLELIPCGVSICQRLCQACYATNIPADECLGELPRLVVQCSSVVQQPPCNASPNSQCFQVDCFSE